MSIKAPEKMCCCNRKPGATTETPSICRQIKGNTQQEEPLLCLGNQLIDFRLPGLCKDCLLTQSRVCRAVLTSNAYCTMSPSYPQDVYLKGENKMPRGLIDIVGLPVFPS